MTNPSILLKDGSEIPEGIMDAFIATLCALHDFKNKKNYFSYTPIILESAVKGRLLSKCLSMGKSSCSQRGIQLPFLCNKSLRIDWESFEAS